MGQCRRPPSKSLSRFFISERTHRLLFGQPPTAKPRLPWQHLIVSLGDRPWPPTRLNASFRCPVVGSRGFGPIASENQHEKVPLNVSRVLFQKLALDPLRKAGRGTGRILAHAHRASRFTHSPLRGSQWNPNFFTAPLPPTPRSVGAPKSSQAAHFKHADYDGLL